MTQPAPTTRFRACLRQVFLIAPLIAPALAAWPAVAHGDEQPRWYNDGYDQQTFLVYGVPHSDYVVMMFACEAGAKTVKIYLQDENSGAQPGEKQSIRLQAGSQHIQFFATGLPNEDSGGADFKAELPLNDTLRQILSASGDLAVIIKGHTGRYPLAGIDQPAATLLAACDAAKPSGKSGAAQ